MDAFPLLLTLFFVALICFDFYSFRRRRNLPPGPHPLPIIGNMLHLSRNPHQSLAHLSKKHGPLMSIHLGTMQNVVVSSPELAKQILQQHGHAFSGRPILQAVHVHRHHEISVGFLPTTDTWRDLRKLCREHMLSPRSLEASQGLRDRELRKLLDYVRGCRDIRRAVDVHEAAFATTLNIMSATLFSREDAAEFESEAARELREAVEGVMRIMNSDNFADFFPILRPLDLQGIKRKAGVCFGKLLGIIEGHLHERLEWRRMNPEASKKMDFLETLVDIIQGNYEYQFTIDHLTHLMLDMFVAGTETVSTTIEWTMSELVLHPHKMKKLKDELKSSIVGDKQLMQESDMHKLPYLEAVIKEVLRYHPPGPLLVPRRAEIDQEVNGYLIPKGTQILINAWAMGRDPSIWKNPECFEPERFLGQTIDFKGQDFELIPFGSGRRICPGFPLAIRMIYITIAALVHNFDWKFEDEKMEETEHRREVFGATLKREVPLRIIPLINS